MSTNAIADMLNGIIPRAWKNHVVSIDNQNSLAEATWHFWVSTSAPRRLPISESNFVRMWKTVILRHVQDVYVREKCQRAVPIRGPMYIPTPLADLLSALGSYYSEHEATHHRIVPPTPPADLPPDSWYELNDLINHEWILANMMMNQFGLVKEHVFGAYHQSEDYTNRPLMLTAMKTDQNGDVSIRARLVGPRQEDAYIRAINDELFEDPFPYQDCNFSMTSRPVRAELERVTYVSKPSPGENFLEEFRCMKICVPPKDHVIAIDAQNGLASATWHYLSSLVGSDELPISEANYIRMWKTVLLKHIQNIFEQEKHLKSDHCIPIYGSPLIPFPLLDLLNRLGWYEDPHTGLLHHIVPPTRPDDSSRPDWWEVDWKIMDQWIRCHRRTSLIQNKLVHEYKFDHDATHGDCPLMLTTSECHESGTVTIRARFSGPGLRDALIRTVNDELFEEPYPVRDCNIVLSSPRYAESFRLIYLGRAE